MRGSFKILILALAVFLTTSATAQEFRPQWHPDGRIGSISLTLGGAYQSFTEPAGLSRTDIQHFSAQSAFVSTARMSLLVGLSLERGDSTMYELSGGFRFYLRNPLDGSLSHNADGPIGGPVLTGLVAVRQYDESDKNSKMTARAALSLPISTRLTLGGSYTYYEEIRPADLDQWTVRINVYPTAYSSASNYINPDGPAGNLGFALGGGGSENGSMGQFEFIFPVSPGTTLRTLFRYEKFEPSPRKSLTFGGSITWYPGF